MGRFLNRLERKFGRRAIPRLTLILIFCFILGYLMELFAPNAVAFLSLDPYYILRGQVWRIFSWIMIPPSSFGLLTVIMLYFYFSIGSALERTWGDFRYNVYMLGGMLISIVVAFATYFILRAVYGTPVTFGTSFSSFYVCMSLLLAFSATYPETPVYLMFVLPLKMKWLGIIDGVMLAYSFISDIRSFVATGFPQYLVGAVAILASLGNFLIFFFGTRNMKRIDPREIRRKSAYRRAMEEAPYKKPVEDASFRQPAARHRCCVCGRTDVTDPELTFRFCSRCSGAKEYCSDHLFNHEHS